MVIFESLYSKLGSSLETRNLWIKLFCHQLKTCRVQITKKQKHVWELFHVMVSVKQIHISAAQWPKIQNYSCSRQLPWCALFLPSGPAQLKKGSTLSDLIRGQGWIYKARRMFRQVSLLEEDSSSQAFNGITQLGLNAVRLLPVPFVIEPITQLQMGVYCGLWPRVTGSEQSEQRPVVKDSTWSSSFFQRARGSLIECPPPETLSARSLTPENDRKCEVQGEERGVEWKGVSYNYLGYVARAATNDFYHYGIY